MQILKERKLKTDGIATLNGNALPLAQVKPSPFITGSVNPLF